MLYKIISGGQTGADRAGLQIAKLLGYTTGGWAPKGYKTLDGPDISLKTLYGLEEHKSEKYPPRTFKNVKESDGTIRFAYTFNSPGEKCTLKALKKYHKPYKDVDIKYIVEPKEIADWIIKNKIKVLNIAGNSEKTCKGIYNFVFAYLCHVLEEVKKINQALDWMGDERKK